MRLPMFEEASPCRTWEKGAAGWTCVEARRTPPGRQDRARSCRAMVLGLRDYVNKSGFPGVLLGLSGGVDSAHHRRGRRRCARP